MRKKNPNFNDCTESIVTYTTVPQKKTKDYPVKPNLHGIRMTGEPQILQLSPT